MNIDWINNFGEKSKPGLMKVNTNQMAYRQSQRFIILKINMG